MLLPSSLNRSDPSTSSPTADDRPLAANAGSKTAGSADRLGTRVAARAAANARVITTQIVMPDTDAASRPAPSASGTEVRDVDFAVPFRHRLRFTHDLLNREADQATLLDCLEPRDARVRVMVVVDSGVAAGHPDLLPGIDRLFEDHPDRLERVGGTLQLYGGESFKNDDGVVDELLSRFNRHNLDRRNYVLVIGGGAILDAVGYAAAIAHRGIRLIRMPSTTLAQDDSGIGVKNAVNLFDKKNWKGTFAVPWAVINDAGLLTHLPDREFCNGFSEAVKVSLLKDPAFFDDLCDHAAAISGRDMEPALDAIERSAVWHLRHITEGGDPFEMLEARPLDFGHWSAHRLEAMTDFELRHGEAVAIGLAIDCLYSRDVLGFPAADADRVIRCLADLRLPLDHPALGRTDELLSGLEEFRQHLGGRLTITLLRGVGDPVDVHEIDHDAMRRAIQELQNRVGLAT